MERQADRQYSLLKDALNFIVGGLGVLFVAAVGLFFYFFGKTKNETKDIIDEMLGKEISKIIERDVTPIQEKLRELQGGVDRLLSFKKRKIVWVADGDKDNIESTLKGFASVGLTQIAVQTPDSPEDTAIGDCDLIIVSFDGSTKAKQILKQVIRQLRDKTATIHLIVYTFGDGTTRTSVEEDEMVELAALRWYSMANFPSTMIAQVASLVRDSAALPAVEG